MIVTIMLNFIVLALLNWIVAAHLHVPETLHTPEIHDRRASATRLMIAGIPRLGGEPHDHLLPFSRQSGVVLSVP